MNPREFIKKNVAEKMKKDGLTQEQISEGVKDAMWFFDNTAMFPKGKVSDECYKHGLIAAKRVKKK